LDEYFQARENDKKSDSSDLLVFIQILNLDLKKIGLI